MTKCKVCEIGTYAHSASEDAPLFENWEVDGMGNIFPPRLYNFCPRCGFPVDPKHKEKARRDRIQWKWDARRMDRCQHLQAKPLEEFPAMLVCPDCGQTFL